MESKDRKLQEYENKNLQLSKRLEETYSTLSQKLTDAEKEISRVKHVLLVDSTSSIATFMHLLQ